MIVILALLLVSLTLTTHAAPLDDYVAAPEPDYGYERLAIHFLDGCTVHVLNFTSLKWMDESFVNHSIWWHYLTIAIPNDIRYPDSAFYHVGSGNNPDDAPTPDNDGYLNTLCGISQRIGAVSGYIKMIPNQPLFFNDSPTDLGKVEDFIIGYTWKIFIESEEVLDPEIIVLFPMVKAAKLGVDAMVEYSNQWNSTININRYMPSGSSKRGWVTWLLGVVDSRVFAMAPRVFDLLNFYENLHHHHRAYGGWSWAFFPYYFEDVPKYLNHPRTQDIGILIDPLVHNDRLTMPKLLTVSSSDEFFLPDGSHYFWTQLNEPKYMSLLENADHGQSGKTGRINDNIVAFFLAAKEPTYVWPTFTWQRNETMDDGTITAWTNPAPTQIHAWWSDTTNITHERRDFRQTINLLSIENSTGSQIPVPGPNPIEWFQTAVDDIGGGTYRITLPKRPEPETFRGFFIQAHFPSLEANKDLILTTEINVLPDILPFPRCVTPEECEGFLK